MIKPEGGSGGGQRSSLMDIPDINDVKDIKPNTRAGIKEEEAAGPLPYTTEPSPKPRVYVQFVYNMVDGYPHVDDNNEFIGYFDFADHTGLLAEGKLFAPGWYDKESPAELSICKISGQRPSGGEGYMDRRWCEYDGRTWGSRW